LKVDSLKIRTDEDEDFIMTIIFPISESERAKFERIWRNIELATKFFAILTINSCSNYFLLELIVPNQMCTTYSILPAGIQNNRLLNAAAIIALGMFDTLALVSFFTMGITVLYFLMTYVLVTRSSLNLFM